jgi:MraZ protein
VGIFGAKWCEVVEDGDEMLFTGTFHRSLDDKLRFAIPKPFRDVFADARPPVLYVAPGTDGSLELYTEASLARIAQALEGGPRNDREVRAFSRLFYAQVQRVEVDKQGRVRLPADLAQWASLQKEVVLLGVRDHIELWDRQRWEAYLDSTQPRYDELAERATPRMEIPSPSRHETPEHTAVEREEGDSLPIRPR